MEWVNSNYRLPIKSWCGDIEKEAMAQAIGSNKGLTL